MYPPVPAGLSRGKHVARLTLKSLVRWPSSPPTSRRTGKVIADSLVTGATRVVRCSAAVAAVERDVFGGEVAGWAGQCLLAGG